MPYRRKRRKKSPSLSKWFHGKMIGLVFLIMGVIIIGIATYVAGIMPEMYVYYVNNTLGVGTTLPDGASGVSNKVIVNLVGWGAGILFVFSGYRRLGLKI